MAKNPSSYSEYVPRRDSKNQRQLNRALYLVGSKGIRGLDRTELKQVARPIIRETNLRMRRIEQENLINSSPAYQFIARQLGGKKPSVGGNNINVIKNNLRLAYDFLHTSTSTVEGAKEYSRWLERTLGGGLSEDEMTSIWQIVHKFEDTHPQKFMNYEYDESIKIISNVARKTGFDIDAVISEVEKIFSDDTMREETDFSEVEIWPSRNNSIRGF